MSDRAFKALSPLVFGDPDAYMLNEAPAMLAKGAVAAGCCEWVPYRAYDPELPPEGSNVVVLTNFGRVNTFLCERDHEGRYLVDADFIPMGPDVRAVAWLRGLVVPVLRSESL